MASVWGELKRRNVVRVVVAYAIVSWLILQLTDVLMPLLSLPEWVGRFVILLLVIGFLLAQYFAHMRILGLLQCGQVNKSRAINRDYSAAVLYIMPSSVTLACVSSRTLR